MAASSSHRQAPSEIEQILSDGSVETLEAAVELSHDHLDKLERIFSLPSEAVETQNHWIKSIRKLRGKGLPPRVVIGVVGNTGSGKSSMINALLDEQKLLPTSGMRACTASAVEVSFNYSHDPLQLYRAEVEFISEQHWHDELRVLLKDILDGEGMISPDCSLPDTVAGRSFCKINAVYPHMTKDMLRQTTPEEMIQDPKVRGVLGLVHKLSATTAQDLCSSLKSMVDSKDKNTKPGEDMEMWPLVKVVRVYCKADALSTGATIVDLPGSHDSNAARAAVAESYMQACSGLWIASAIHRAVDDKSAKDLFGDSFKRQLKLDGVFSAITFVCTKTDDLVTDEIIEHIEEKEVVRDLLARIDARKGEQATLHKQLYDLQVQKDRVAGEFTAKSNLQDVWDSLRSQLNEGVAVFRPAESPKKRKCEAGHGGQRKKPFDTTNIMSNGSDKSDKSENSDDNSDDSEESDVDVNGVSCEAATDRTPLSAEQIQVELENIKNDKKTLYATQKQLKSQTKDVKKTLSGLKTTIKDLEYLVKSKCIIGRNIYVKAAIKKDFAMGAKELDQEVALEQDEDNFNPDVSLRDYDQVGRALPVFCVSARTYNGLKGRTAAEKARLIQGNTPAVELTEIPQLQQHVKGLTKAGRIDAARQFLLEMNDLLVSMSLWATGAFEIGLTKEDQVNNELFVRRQLEQLVVSLQVSVTYTVDAIQKRLQNTVHTALDKGAKIAATEAINTVEKWSAHKSQAGIAYNSYAATCRRSGMFGAHNFNRDLLDPVTMHLSQPWDQLFSHTIPRVLSELTNSSRDSLARFHEETLSGIPRPGATALGLQTLETQLKTHEAALGAIPSVLRTSITHHKRRAHRALEPALQKSMSDAYQTCLEQRGVGCYKRMKTIMREHIEDFGEAMFEQAAEAVKDELGFMCLGIRGNLNASVEDLMERLQHDYLAVFAGKEQMQAEKSLRTSLRKPLADTQGCFTDLLLRRRSGHPVTDTPQQELEDMPNYFAPEGSDDVEFIMSTPIKSEWSQW